MLWPLSAFATTSGCSSGFAAAAVTPATALFVHDAGFPGCASSAASHNATPCAGIGAPAASVTVGCGVTDGAAVSCVAVSATVAGAGAGGGSSFFLQAVSATRQSDHTTNVLRMLQSYPNIGDDPRS